MTDAFPCRYLYLGQKLCRYQRIDKYIHWYSYEWMRCDTTEECRARGRCWWSRIRLVRPTSATARFMLLIQLFYIHERGARDIMYPDISNTHTCTSSTNFLINALRVSAQNRYSVPDQYPIDTHILHYIFVFSAPIVRLGEVNWSRRAFVNTFKNRRDFCNDCVEPVILWILADPPKEILYFKRPNEYCCKTYLRGNHDYSRRRWFPASISAAKCYDPKKDEYSNLSSGSKASVKNNDPK